MLFDPALTMSGPKNAQDAKIPSNFNHVPDGIRTG